MSSDVNMTSGTQEDNTSMKTDTGVKSNNIIELSASQFQFEPDKIVIQSGSTVTIKVKSTDVNHGFAIKEYGINVELPPNVEKTIEFTADKSGTFTFYCSVFCGAGHRNMRGTLIVE
jgi:cytochrome c oxidase subunit 2